MATKSGLIPRKKPKQKRAQKLVDAILEATTQVLERFNFDESSTNKIAERAGVSIGSLYQYFPNKESLVGVLMDRQLQKQTGEFIAILEENQHQSLMVVIDLIVDRLLALYYDKRIFLKNLFENVTRLKRIETFIEQRKRFQDALNVDLKRRSSEIDVEDISLASFLLVNAVLGIMEGILFYQKIDHEKDGLRKEIREVMIRYLRVKSI